MLHVIGLAALAVIVAACSSTPSGADRGDAQGKWSKIPFVTILDAPGRYSDKLRQNEVLLIDSHEELERQWAHMHDGMGSLPPLPPADHSSETLILATAGERRTGGYAVATESIEEVGGAYAITVVIVEPGPACRVTQMHTTPAQLVRTEKLRAPVEVIWKRSVQNCN